MDERALLVLAYGIAEYDTVLRSINALRSVGQPLPWSVSGRVSADLSDLIWRWPTATTIPGEEREPRFDRVVREARAHVTNHQRELDELLSESER